MPYLKKALFLIAILAIASVYFTAGCDKKSTDSEGGNLFSVEFNIALPADEEQFINKPVVAFLWVTTGPEESIEAVDSAIISDNLNAIINLNDVEEGIYTLSVIVFPDSIAPGFEVTEGCAFWLGIDTNVDRDMNVSVGEEYWQYFVEATIFLNIKGVPSGNEGELIAVALLVEGSNLMDIYDSDSFLLGGVGAVFNNAAFVMLDNTGEEPDPDTLLPSGTYDLMAIVDRDGTRENYENDTTFYNPFDVGEPFWKTTFVFDENNPQDNFQLLTGSFSDMVGISGSVTCPEWASGGGDIYMLAFDTNPFADSIGDKLASIDIINQPGTFSIPYLPGDSAYIVGVWDVNDNIILEGDEEGGPDLGDYVGFYGNSIDSLEAVICGYQGTNDIDFNIDIPWDDSLDSGGM